MFRRILAAAVILATAAVLLVAAWPQLFDLHRTFGVAHVVSLRGVAIAGAVIAIVVLALAALVVRSFRRMAASLIVLLLVFAGVSAAVLGTRGFGGASAPEPTAPDARPADQVTVLTWNTLGPATTPSQIADLIVEVGADIVVLPETTQETAIDTAVELRDRGARMWAHTAAYDRISPARSTSLLISTRLGDYNVDVERGITSVLPSVLAESADGSGPSIVAVHAVAPVRNLLDNWRGDLTALAELCRGDNIIMAGDFNATIDHFWGLGSTEAGTPADPLRASSRLGDCGAASVTAGAGAVGTWPTWLPPEIGAPIDHVMATDDWAVDHYRVIDDRDASGSDHRPVVAVLSRTG